MSWFVYWPVLPSIIGAAIASVTDLRARVIPNWLTLPLLMVGVIGHGFVSGGTGIGTAALGSLGCAVVPMFLFYRGALGGGDVKLFAALGGLLGARAGLELQLASFACLSGFALLYVAWHGRLGALLLSSLRATLHLAFPSRFPRAEVSEDQWELPMGLSIFMATLALVLREVTL